ncbi:energy-coupling factor ABC transporter permease [Georgenia faecalis]|uniref:energy-coupling factor ABC transporter permease n=1 Tax=Georgenia faecalis TaxID=2483799 RepID=UPI000FD90E8A|nr:energy-coupling factor ABC transporter permease [Georgenia faecalis]
MHVPDHFLTDTASITTGVAAAAAVGYAAYRARPALTRDTVVMAAATTGFVFAVQMLNYPVASGTSGHLMGGALAAALLGPWLGILSVTVVLGVQSLVFADGGITALGTNVLLMAVVGTLVGWAVMRGARALPRGRGAPAAALGALVSVPAAAAVFVGLFALGGTVGVPVAELTTQMLAVHALIGIGEAAITGAVVAVVLAVAPGAAAIDEAGAAGPVAAPVTGRPRGPVAVLGAGAVLAAVVLSSFAAASPDGLEATASALGFAGAARDHALAGLPLADYGAAGGVFVGVAGLVGVALCAALAAVALAGLARRQDRERVTARA